MHSIQIFSINIFKTNASIFHIQGLKQHRRGMEKFKYGSISIAKRQYIQIDPWGVKYISAFYIWYVHRKHISGC